MTERVFVYGTLRPGSAAWDLVAPVVSAVEPATAAGTVRDTGRGYPGARFGGAGTIDGTLLWVDPTALPTLDEYEGVAGGLYRRIQIVVRTAAGPVPAWAYEYVDATTDLPVVDPGS